MTEEELVRSCLRGGRKAQDELYARYSGRLYALCLRYTRNNAEAEDVMQDGFIKIFRNMKNFDGGNGKKLLPWMSRIMVNTALNYLRDNKRFRLTEDISEYQELWAEGNDEEGIFDTVKPEEILDMIRAMPDGYRTVFNLYAFDGFSHVQISEVLGISVNTSKTQLMKARRHLSQRLHEKILSTNELKHVI